LPPRGTHQPGTHFLYNNWDFNALGTILERHTSKSMFNDFADTIATPSGMQDFDRSQQHYDIEPWSEHRTYAFHFSTRDLARFGQLYLRGGQHAGSTIIPPEWVRSSAMCRGPKCDGSHMAPRSAGSSSTCWMSRAPSGSVSAGRSPCDEGDHCACTRVRRSGMSEQ
jgi:CubicO group peptidase (beta-lactamase class C family)